MNPRQRQIREARRLRSRFGWGYKRIAKRVGANRDQVRHWVAPELHRARSRRWQQAVERRKRYRGETIHRKRTADRAIFVLLWHDGASLREIAARLGTTPQAAGVRLARMRAEGFDLPYRYRMRNGRRIA